MTPEQDKQFNDYGCACRCLIKLREMHGRPITRSEFIDKFFEKYKSVWNEKCGGTTTSVVIDIARDLGLCTDADVRTDQEYVKRTRPVSGVLLFTDREKQKDGTFSPNYHCRLVQGRRSSTVWELWEPYKDGTDKESVPRSFEEVAAEGVHFLLLHLVVPRSE